MNIPSLRTSIAVCSLVAAAGCGGGGSHESTSESSGSTSSGATSEAPAASSDAGESSSGDASATAQSAPASSEGSDAGASSTSGTANGPADVPMHIVSAASARGFFRGVDIERHEDGSLSFHGTAIGTMNHGQVTTIDGQHVPLEGRLSLGTRTRGREHLEVRPDGSIAMDGGYVLTIGADGDVVRTRHGHPAEPVAIHVDGFHTENLAEADTLLVLGLMKADLASR